MLDLQNARGAGVTLGNAHGAWKERPHCVCVLPALHFRNPRYGQKHVRKQRPHHNAEDGSRVQPEERSRVQADGDEILRAAPLRDFRRGEASRRTLVVAAGPVGPLRI